MGTNRNFKALKSASFADELKGSVGPEGAFLGDGHGVDESQETSGKHCGGWSGRVSQQVTASRRYWREGIK